MTFERWQEQSNGNFNIWQYDSEDDCKAMIKLHGGYFVVNNDNDRYASALKQIELQKDVNATNKDS